LRDAVVIDTSQPVDPQALSAALGIVPSGLAD
jgi:hypothetical protein